MLAIYKYVDTQRVIAWLLLFEATAGSSKMPSVFDKQRERRDPQFLVVVVEVGVTIMHTKHLQSNFNL